MDCSILFILIGVYVVAMIGALVMVKLSHRISWVEIKELNRGKWFKDDLDKINKRIDAVTDKTKEIMEDVDENTEMLRSVFAYLDVDFTVEIATPEKVILTKRKKKKGKKI